MTTHKTPVDQVWEKPWEPGQEDEAHDVRRQEDAMSTRCTISYVGPIHIYEECNSGQICLELNAGFFCDEGFEVCEVNKKYDSLVLKKEWLEKLYKELGQYLERMK